MHPYSKGQNFLGCIRKIISSRSKELILPLYSALLSRIQEGYAHTGVSPVKAMKITERLENLSEYLSHKEKLRKLGPLSLEKSRQIS